MRRCGMTALLFLASTLLRAGGFGLGIQTAVDLGKGSAIVPRLDYLHATDSTTAGLDFPVDLTATADIVALGADYDYFLGGRTGQGFYVLGGLGLANANISISGATSGYAASTTSTQTRIYAEAGLGYQFNRHFGLELLYKDLQLQDVNLQVAGEWVAYSFPAAVQANVILRF